MQSKDGKPYSVKPRQNTVGAGLSKQVCKVHSRKIPYRVGYSWNKGGRLKELRIRHLARKFVKIWIQRTFGRILPHKAKSHYNSVVLRRAFEGWRDEWWTCRREWSLAMRAECHHRYYLCNLVFHHWQMFVSLQREKKNKLQNAQLFADRKRMRLVLDRWEVFTDLKCIKKRMLRSALELNRLTTLHLAWRLWQTRLQHQQNLYSLEKQALKQKEISLQHKAWCQWKEKHTAALCRKDKESKAALHFILNLKRKTLHRWKCYVSCVQTKKGSQAVAQHAHHHHLLLMCWSKWKSVLLDKQNEEDRLQAAESLALQNNKRRALEHWRAYIMLCREDAEKDRIAAQHHHHHLLCAGFQGLSLNVIRKKTHRLNNNMAVQQYHQTMKTKHWRLWGERLEEAEDRSFQPMTETALTKYRTSLLTRCLQHWREKLAEQRHMQELEHHADLWFAERMVPQCFNSWNEFALQRKLNKERRHKAAVFNQQRQYSWVFYTWWGRSEKHKELMLSERMAILHEERGHLQRAWSHWRQRTEQQIIEEEKQEAAELLYQHRLLHKTMTQWKDNSSEIRDRRNREQKACHQGNLSNMRWAVENWKKFVRSQHVKKGKLQQMQCYHEVKHLKHTFVAWKERTLQMSRLYSHAEELHRQQKENSCRKLLCDWRGNTVLLAKVRFMEQQAQDHYGHVLQLKVFLAWKEATQHAVSKHLQQREAVSRAQRSINEVRLLRTFRQWRKQTRAARRERICMEKARRHHESKLLSKAMKAWNKHRCKCRKNKIMKRQGILLLRLKMYQTYFEQWRIKLQHRRRDAQQTQRALWHWSLSLQAKVLCGWRLWVTEQRRKQEQAARAAEVYRDQLLREGVTCILTYAAHMSDLTTSLTQHSEEQRSRHLQRVVKRCALRWKQRALCKPQKEKEVKGQPPKKIVTFCLTGLESVSPSDSVEQGVEDRDLRKLLLSRSHRRQPRRCEELFESPIKTNPQEHSGAKAAPKPSKLCPEEHNHTLSSYVHSAKDLVTSTHQSISIPSVPTSEIHVATAECPQENQDVLLPPSAFMTTGTQDMLGKPPLIPALKQQSSAYPDVHLRASSGETLEAGEAITHSTSSLTSELVKIQTHMQTYQQDRKQLRAWQKLRQVLQSWLQTSGKDEQMDKSTVCEELKELEERIARLSTDLGKRKPMMLLHAERIQHLRTALGVGALRPHCVVPLAGDSL
ncbi:LOW QUALITY PROTEIN: protein SFI1 homolog [Notolabrus celidotus]|uniref:LOW QUALITY PROTEIN: protein SFI1 homolog n=1 Tax=Notolabrus celidotus TaxID=1203425 RepID=UPI00148FD820|nr:LOW QUALITY PROTEIN: protein SFI1 homolog [Notolabrus celidotus]